MKPIIKRLHHCDLAGLYDIYNYAEVTENSSQLPFLDTNKISKLFTNENNYTLIAEWDGLSVGHITFILETKSRSKHCAGLAIAVHPDFQGKGVGKALMEEALNQADNWLNLVRIELEVHADNDIAIGLYEKLGFNLEGRKKLSTFKAGHYIDTLFMARIHPNYG